MTDDNGGRPRISTWLPPNRNNDSFRPQRHTETGSMPPYESLVLMKRARALNEGRERTDEFIDSVTGFFRRRGFLTKRQYAAVQRWVDRELAKLSFEGRINWNPAPQGSRFQSIVDDEDTSP